MQFPKRFLLVLAISIVGLSSCKTPQLQQASTPEQTQPKAPLTVEQIDEIAKAITVRIDAPESGSGVIIAKKRGFLTNPYYVLTAKHVIEGRSEFDIITHDKKHYPMFGSENVVGVG